MQCVADYVFIAPNRLFHLKLITQRDRQLCVAHARPRLQAPVKIYSTCADSDCLFLY